MDTAERNAGYESSYFAGAGFVDAVGKESASMVTSVVDSTLGYLQMQPGASGGCGGGK
jgi:hypothetical protein